MAASLLVISKFQIFKWQERLKRLLRRLTDLLAYCSHPQEVVLSFRNLL